MGRTKKTVPGEPAEVKPKRKSRAKQPELPATEPVTLSEPLATLAEKHGLQPASQALKQLTPPEPELEAWAAIDAARARKELIDRPEQPEPPKKPGDTDIAPAPETNGKHPKSFASRVTGPRKRVDEPAASYTGKDVRVIKDGDTWQVEIRREVTAQEYDKLLRSGFDDVSDRGNGSLWNASQKTLREHGTDVNILAVVLDAKGERLGRAR